MTDAEVRAESASRAVPEGAITEPLGDVLATDTFVPRLLALLSNALVWRESHELRAAVGLGTNDWRVVSALAVRPGSPSNEVSEFLSVNKAVVSKSVNTLLDRGLILVGDGPRGSRPLFLNDAGARMHDVMKPISQSGEEAILEGMTAREVADLTSTLQRMLDRIRPAT
ncbi:MAG: MarR family winged helix-turn-helix transcriptional regulator [Microbacterium sp.]